MLESVPKPKPEFVPKDTARIAPRRLPTIDGPCEPSKACLEGERPLEEELQPRSSRGASS